LATKDQQTIYTMAMARQTNLKTCRYITNKAKIIELQLAPPIPKYQSMVFCMPVAKDITEESKLKRN